MAFKKHNRKRNCELLEESIEIEELCAEIYLTIHREILFYCTLCSTKFKDCQLYVNHIKKRHKLISQSFEDFLSHNQYKEDKNYDDVYNEELVHKNDEILSEIYNNVSETEEQLSFFKGFEDADSNLTSSSITIKPKIEMTTEYEKIENKDYVWQNEFINFKETIDMSESSSKSNDESFLEEYEDIIETSKDNLIGTDMTKEDLKQLFIKNPTETRPIRKRTFCNKIDNAERKYICPICGAAFKDNNNMRGHIRRHSKEKRFECPQCSKKFYTGSEVNVHLRSHTKERPFLCSLCGRTFQTNCKLSDHIKRHTNQRDFKCSICQKAFFDSDTLRDHMKCHSSDRPYECEKCSAKFVRPNSLANHMKLHANKREYSCMLCPAAFNQQAGLFSHLKSAHKKA